MTSDALTLLIQLAYLVASFAFVFSLRALTRTETARSGYRLAIIGMAIAVVATLLHEGLTYEWILAGLVVGALIGYPLGMFVPMTAMPERIAFSHAFGALAATLVGIGEFMHDTHHGFQAFRAGALGFEVLFGALTVTGSLMAFGKLASVLPGRPLTYPLQNISNISMLAGGVGCLIYLVLASAGLLPMVPEVFYVMVGIGALVGILMIIPIGGADMPVVISLLNSYAGLAACATGFAIDNTILIVAGALDGASGFILSIAMSKAMNRSFANVIFGAFGATDQTAAAGGGAGPQGHMHPITAEDAALRLAYAERVIFVPGYGLAVSQAQHQIRELADVIEKRGGNVLYAIHPVAGRMPGHMNVLLAEAGVPYDQLLDMEEINHKFTETDVVVVVGANDVVNPAARTNKGSPIYGMPILAAYEARSIIVLKRGQGAGFSGIENELFFNPKTSMLYGDAKKSLTTLVTEVKSA